MSPPLDLTRSPRRAVALAAVTLATTMLTPVALAASPAAAAPVTCADSQADPAAATSMAKACGKDVEVMGQRTETAQTFAKPGGGYTVKQFLAPRWTRKGSGWADVDTTLAVAADGKISPKAAVLPVTFSPGGTGPLATLTEGDKTLAVSWPGGALPKPVLAGDSATYPEVLPGVDLTVTASATGFSEVLVVKNRQAAANPALAEVKFGLATQGVQAVATGAGGLEARDKAGKAVFRSPTPLMWDSAKDQPAAAKAKGASAADGAGEESAAPSGARKAVMPVKAQNGQLSVVPDKQMVNDPATVYPIFIDPSWTGWLRNNNWTTVWSKYPNQSFNQKGDALRDSGLKGGAGSGRTCDTSTTEGVCTSEQYVVRSLFQLDTGAVRGKQIQRAIFSIDQKWAWKCDNSSQGLWRTEALGDYWQDYSQVTWAVSNDWNKFRWHESTSTPANHRYNATLGCGGTGPVEFNITSWMAGVASRGEWYIGLGLRALEESWNYNLWKRYDQTRAFLSIDYNTPPDKPFELSTDQRGCVTGDSRPILPTGTPNLRARATDPDGDSMTVNFTVLKDYNWGQRQDGSHHNIGNWGYAQWAPNVGDGRYVYWAESNDGRGGTSGWSALCEFEVDLTDPVVPTVTSALYTEGCQGCGSVGKPGQFTFKSSDDVVKFRWGFGSLSNETAAPWKGAEVTVNWTPREGGPAAQHLMVEAVDHSGRTALKNYYFIVKMPEPAVGNWPLNEGEGATQFADTTRHNRAAVLTGGTPGLPGRIPTGDTAAGFSAAKQESATAPHVLDTSKSFSVAAWVKTNDLTSHRTALSQDGAVSTGFQLQVAGDCGCWKWVLPGSDGNHPGGTTVTGPKARAGVWVHLAGVFDSEAKVASLYANGTKVGEQPVTFTPWNAAGSLVFGRTKWNGVNMDWWDGQIAGVYAWDRVITHREVNDLGGTQRVGLTGAWRFESPGRGPDADETGNQLLNFHPIANVPLTGAGKIGTGLHVGELGAPGEPDKTGWADTDNPVIDTSQSFTVSAWAKLNSPSLPGKSMAVVSQDGNVNSAFFLRYRWYNNEGHWAFTCTKKDELAPGFSDALSASPLTTADLNKWVHLVGVYDAPTSSMTLYVDDVLQRTSPCDMWNAQGKFNIGRAKYEGWSSNYWMGDVDEVRVWAGALNGGFDLLTVDGPRPARLQGVHSTRCLDTPNGNTADGTQLQLWWCNGTPAQALTLFPDGTMRLLGKCAGVGQDRVVVEMRTCDPENNPGQKWIHNPATQQFESLDRCLDPVWAGTADGTKLIAWSCHTGDNQKWRIVQ
ncbi:LamG-like jellyroll fold domain-containing protein [Longispora albida]|uniref:LamG-like jellyroll fold domain-containing protein n=1 Tax=Longispora albida TaxID=203523 RepID=UPI0012F95A48|nr:LamG-like jellyroll fold domain-containing protein [Longispora albida]